MKKIKFVTKEESKLIKQYRKDGMKIRQIAKKVKRSLSTVCVHIHK